MTHCPESARVQDYLDQLLPPFEEREFRRHLEDCAACAAEIEAFGRVFGALARLPLTEPDPVLTERVLAKVLPSRIRRRWLTAVGWAYAGSLSACAAAVALTMRLPQAHAWFDSLSGAASRESVRIAVIGLDVLGYMALGLASGWGALARLFARIAPVPRVLGSALQQPEIALALAAAAVIGVALLALLRGRSARGPSTLSA